MKFVIFGILIVALSVLSYAQDSPVLDAILEYDNDNIGVGDYSYNVQTGDGKSHSEQGVLQNAGTDNEFVAVQGQFSYIGNDNKNYSITYTADEEGFRADGEHIPMAETIA